MLKNNKGVSLIEVLITCLLVGIVGLLSIRIHNYSTEKSLATDGVRIMREIVDSELIYRLENKQWCYSFDDLPMKISGERLSETSIRTNNFVYTLCSDIAYTSTIVNPKAGSNLVVRARRCYPGQAFDESSNDGYAMYYKVDGVNLTRQFSVGIIVHDMINKTNESVCKYLERKFK